MTKQREGWLGDEYVRIYAAADRQRIYTLYDFATFLPGYEPWGSFGLDALCLGPDSRLYTIDWIPLEEEYRRQRYDSVAALEADIARLHEAPLSYQHFQKEVHLVHPIVLGGDPKVAPVMLDQDTHAQACCYFNKLCRHLKTKTNQ
ncbi:MAG: hypothetical protein SFY80_16765 [Verrucomicrobiota bacterium]|nr:hypothetical protein [Verrucomicrobiota bacterium]